MISCISMKPYDLSCNYSILVQGNDLYRIRGKQNSIMRIVRIVQRAAKVVEALGVGAEVVVEVGRDHTQDRQEVSQDRGHAREVLTIVEIEVVGV